jgi:hypothetical protein
MIIKKPEFALKILLLKSKCKRNPNETRLNLSTGTRIGEPGAKLLKGKKREKFKLGMTLEIQIHIQKVYQNFLKYQKLFF